MNKQFQIKCMEIDIKLFLLVDEYGIKNRNRERSNKLKLVAGFYN